MPRTRPEGTPPRRGRRERRPQPPRASEYVTVQKAAQMLACSPKTVRRLIASGEIEAYRMGARAIRIPLDAVNAALGKRLGPRS